MRIASLSPAATEILSGLGLGDEHEIVCTDQFSNFPDEAKEIPKLRGHDRVDIEALRKHVPEIVLTGTVVQEKLAATLRNAGFAVIHQDPRTIAEIYASIRALGALFDRDKEAEALVLAMQKGFNDVKRKAGKMSVGQKYFCPTDMGRESSTLLGQERSCFKGVRLYIEEWPAFAPLSGARAGRPSLPFASGNWVPEIARIAGGEQLPLGDGHGEHRRTLSRAVTLEEVERWDPELIVISWCGAGALAPKELLLEREGWGQLRAIKGGRVRVIDDSLLNRPGPRLVEGAQRLYGWLFEMLH